MELPSATTDVEQRTRTHTRFLATMATATALAGIGAFYAVFYVSDPGGGDGGGTLPPSVPRRVTDVTYATVATTGTHGTINIRGISSPTVQFGTISADGTYTDGAASTTEKPLFITLPGRHEQILATLNVVTSTGARSINVCLPKNTGTVAHSYYIDLLGNSYTNAALTFPAFLNCPSVLANSFKPHDLAWASLNQPLDGIQINFVRSNTNLGTLLDQGQFIDGDSIIPEVTSAEPMSLYFAHTQQPNTVTTQARTMSITSENNTRTSFCLGPLSVPDGGLTLYAGRNGKVYSDSLLQNVVTCTPTGGKPKQVTNP